MARIISAAARVSLLVLAAGLLVSFGLTRAARGDTCYETAKVNIDCSDKQAPAQAEKKGPPRRAKIAKSADSKKFDAITKRITDAQGRVESALAHPGAPGAEGKYKAAMSDLHRAYADAIANNPADKEFAAGVQRYEAELAREAADSGWGQAPPAARAGAADAPAQPASGPAEPPRGPDNIMAIGSNVYVCDEPITGHNASCREIAAKGQSCTAVILSDGVVGWRDSVAPLCSPEDLARRAGFLKSNPETAAAIAATQPGFAMRGSETDAEIARLTSPRCDLLVGNLVAAAGKNDGKAAFDAYEALKNAGGCGVLQYVKEEQPAAPAGNDSRFIQRGATPMLDSTAGACDRDPQGCAAVLSELKAGTSPAAVGAMISNAIGIGLQLGGMMAQGMSLAQPATPTPHVTANAPRLTAPSVGQPGAPSVRQPTVTLPRALSCTYYGCTMSDGSTPNLGGRPTVTGPVGR